MTRSLIIEVTAVETLLPPGKTFLHRVFDLVGTVPIAVVRTPDLSARFDNLADGDYTAKVTDIATDESVLSATPPTTVTVGAEFYMASASLAFMVV